MALEYIAVAWVLVVECLLILLITIPSVRGVRSFLVPTITRLLQPALAVVPMAAFLLLDVYWKFEHKLACEGPMCTSADRDRFEKSVVKNQRNFMLAMGAIFLYWVLWRVCNLHTHILRLEAAVEKARKS